MSSRTSQRRDYSHDVRLSLLESDADQFEDVGKELISRLEAVTLKVESKLSKIIWALMGLLISISTACVVALFLGVGGVR